MFVGNTLFAPTPHCIGKGKTHVKTARFRVPSSSPGMGALASTDARVLPLNVRADQTAMH
jgi:hypothetical protein